MLCIKTTQGQLMARHLSPVHGQIASHCPKNVFLFFSSMNGHMERFFVKKDSFRPTARNSRPFSICIVDEASQCVEPEMLIPFRLGFTKIVMVGDPEQLPGRDLFGKWHSKHFYYSFIGFSGLFLLWRYSKCPKNQTRQNFRHPKTVQFWNIQFSDIFN